MKRFKTKQEFREEFKNNENHFYTGWRVKRSAGYEYLNETKLFGIPSEDDKHYGGIDWMITDNPHPFDSMDIKVRVTPKQSKKLQKKAFKMGYKWINGVDCALQTGIGEFFYIRQGQMSHGSSFDTFREDKATELTYKMWMNGTVPKKKQFKVGDWVEVVGPNHTGEIIEIIDTLERDNCPYKLNVYPKAWFRESSIKHTTKPKEQPLMFKGHEVVEVDVNLGGFKKFKIGCKELLKNDLRQFMEVCTTASPDATPNEIYDFLQKHQSRLL